MGVLAGKAAPDFTAPTVLGDGTIDESFRLSGFQGQRYAALFFYPLDFTFVCPTELIAIDRQLHEFEERNVQVIGCSVDSQYSHAAWRRTPTASGGIGPVGFPIVADLTKSIARSYDVLADDAIALRGSFLIDLEGIVQHQVVNNLPLGRNVDEMIRMVDALQFHESYGEVCPAGWNKGHGGMVATSEGVAAYLAQDS